MPRNQHRVSLANGTVNKLLNNHMKNRSWFLPASFWGMHDTHPTQSSPSSLSQHSLSEGCEPTLTTAFVLPLVKCGTVSQPKCWSRSHLWRPRWPAQTRCRRAVHRGGIRPRLVQSSSVLRHEVSRWLSSGKFHLTVDDRRNGST